MAELGGETQAVSKCRDIEGWLEEDEARVLYKHAAELGQLGPVLEVGSFNGKSTVVLGLAAKSVGSRVVAVDPHQGINYWQGDLPPLPHLGGPSLASFRANLEAAGVDDVVEVLVMTSVEAFDVTEGYDPFSFVFVDANHGYEHVRQDFDLWSQRLITGGVIAFHDANGKIPGPPRVVSEVRERTDFEFISLVRQLASFRRVR